MDDGTPQNDNPATPESGSLERGRVRQALRAKMFGGVVEPVKVGRFELQGRIGAGGMGVVYRAHDPDLDRTVAIKLLHREAMDRGGRGRFVREAQTLARLSHPNVVGVHEVGEQDGRLFIVMEFVRGRTLRAWVEEDSPTPDAILDAFTQAGCGLVAAHEAGVVHRDFKPANVILADDGRVRVLDFGLAYAGTSAMPSIEDEEPDPLSRLTQTGALLGTPAYMAPEQFEGGVIDARTDQFSFCVALWECLFGERPFAGETFEELRGHVVGGKLREAGRAASGRIASALRRGLSSNPEDRFGDMEALLSALEPVRRRGALWAGLGATALASMGVGVWATSDSPLDPCPDPIAQLVGTWDAETQDKLRELIVDEDPVGGPERWERTRTNIDTWVDTWVTASRENCEATKVEGKQPIQTMRKRDACLDTRLRTLQALVAGLRTDARLVPWAMPMSRNLRAVISCEQENVGAVWPPLPADPAERNYLEQLRSKVIVAELLSRCDPEAFRSLVEELRTMVEGVDDGPLLAMFLHHAGIDGDNAERARTSERAYWEAERVGDDRFAALAASNAAMRFGVIDQWEDAKRWSEIARAKAERVGNPDELMVIVSNRLAYVEADLEARIELQRRVARRAESVLGLDHPYTSSPLNNLANSYLDAARYEKAAETAQRCLDSAYEAMGRPNTTTSGCATLLAWSQGERGQCNLVERTIDTHVLVDGMELSTGTVLELSAALEKCNLARAISIVEEHLRQVDGQRAIDLKAWLAEHAPESGGANVSNPDVEGP